MKTDDPEFQRAKREAEERRTIRAMPTIPPAPAAPTLLEHARRGAWSLLGLLFAMLLGVAIAAAGRRIYLWGFR